MYESWTPPSRWAAGICWISSTVLWQSFFDDKFGITIRACPVDAYTPRGSVCLSVGPEPAGDRRDALDAIARKRLRGMNAPTLILMDVDQHAGLPFPRSLPEFQRLFSGDAACAEYLEKVRWGDGFVCPHCGVTGAPFRVSIRPGSRTGTRRRSPP